MIGHGRLVYYSLPLLWVDREREEEDEEEEGAAARYSFDLSNESKLYRL